MRNSDEHLRLLMIDSMNNDYCTPQAIIYFHVELVLCSSPTPGGNESLVYEEW